MRLWPFAAFAICAAAGAAAVPAVLGAQRVSGTVSLPGGAPGGGVLVIAQDSAGAEITRAVTSDEGRFALPLPRPGFARVLLQRVGFMPTVVLERSLAAAEVVQVEPLLSSTYVTLPPRSAVSPSSCGNSVSDRQYVGILMEELRKALTAVQMTSQRAGVTARWAVTDHRLEANGRDTSRFFIQRRSGPPNVALGTPVLSELQRSGFVVVAGKDRIFRGFDVATLLSPWFADSYCFTAREGSPTSFAVDFAPKQRRRDYVDVEGSILIERATMALQEVTYRYVGLSSDEENRDGGGRLRFTRTAGGTWLVADWFIRYPQVGVIELQTFRSLERSRLLQPDVMGHEILSWETTALLEGTRRIYVKEAGVGEGPQGPIRAACPERVVASRTGAARGRLLWEGRPVSGSRIRATWRAALDIGGEEPLWRDETRETLSSSRGDWTLCDLPAGTTVELSWEVMGRRSATSLRVERDQLVTLDADGKPVP